MVVALGPGKFYGSSLPCPRFHHKEDRVDPPASVLDPLLSWASDAHWSMGGLSFKRLRLQGKIEGNLQKLRTENENRDHIGQISTPVSKSKVNCDDDSPPPAPILKKRRRRAVLINDDDEDDESEKKSLVRNLDDDFKMESTENAELIPDRVCSRTRSMRSMVMVEEEDESDGGENSQTLKINQGTGSFSGSRRLRRLKKSS